MLWLKAILISYNLGYIHACEVLLNESQSILESARKDMGELGVTKLKRTHYKILGNSK
jgi:hypothetical protein